MSGTNPYDSTALADVVLCSSDRVDFHVLKTFLCYVSPIFKDLFNLSQESATEEHQRRNGLPVIPVTETSKTLRLLLDSIYPQEYEPQLNDATLFLNVAKAAQKYCMKKVENKFRRRIINSSLMISRPFRMYAIAIDLEWEDVAIHAARQTLQTPLDKLPRARELNNITGSGFYRFLEYRLRCESSSKPSVEQLMKLPKATPYGGVDSTPGVVDASKPFDSSAPSDIILRSSNGVDFFVIESLIRIASPSQSLTLLNPGGQVRDGRTVFQIPEESSVLYQLLCLIYPYADQLDMHNCRLYIWVVLALRRYGMTATETRLQAQAATTPLLSKEPMRVYIVASALGWNDLAKSAALNTLSQPLAEMVYMEQFDLITGMDLHQLMAFRFKCADAACDVINLNAMYSKYGPGHWSKHHSSYEHNGPTKERVFGKLRSCPRGLTIAEAYTVEDNVLGTLQSDSRMTISKSAFIKMMQCRREIEGAVEAAVAKASFDS
ncbi:hypothetical protein APHAL10511_005264 [Amanita phalloides]|nr:hypothetical protein APHAL10511_005264 [Amanita phalloides]